MPLIHIIDDLTPEDNAMLQALYSRSSSSVLDHLKKVRKTGSGRFMENYYVGYGHKSIADCGSTTIYIEQVSLLAAKAIQDWPLYSGQETSTRYIDMAAQSLIDPINTALSKSILDNWMYFYSSKQAEVASIVRKRYPIAVSENPDIYERAVKAKVFDILRGFLPAGITTQLSWHTNLRQARDHLDWLSRHPLQEVKDIALDITNALKAKYPSSGFGKNISSGIGVSTDELGKEQDKWKNKAAQAYTYSADGKAQRLYSTIKNQLLNEYTELLNSRPKGCELPRFLDDLGNCQFNFFLDFGSFRDLQRHRYGICRMPLLDLVYHFEPWYLDQLDNPLREEAESFINDQAISINKICKTPEVRQYYTALGFLVPVNVTYPLSAAVYVMELRSNKAVHPTLRRQVHNMIKLFREAHPTVLLHADMSASDWYIHRGTQTITEKQ